MTISEIPINTIYAYVQGFKLGKRHHWDRGARQDVFEHIELFYNPKRKHTNNGMLSPVDFEIRQQKPTKAGV